MWEELGKLGTRIKIRCWKFSTKHIEINKQIRLKNKNKKGKETKLLHIVEFMLYHSYICITLILCK